MNVLFPFILLSSCVIITWITNVHGQGCTYGGSPDCVFPCNCADESEVCDEDTGHCTSQCKDGPPVGFTWSGPGCRVGNVAFGKPTKAIGTYSSAYPASAAVDGNTNGNLSGTSCFHSGFFNRFESQDTGIRDWWYVDLGVVHIIYNVVIFNSYRSSTRLRHFHVYVSDSNNGLDALTARTCAYHEGGIGSGSNVTLQCNNTETLGRYVSVVNSLSDYLHYYFSLCEVVVIGAQAIDCSLCAENSSCDPLNGCQTCPQGKRTPDCKKGKTAITTGPTTVAPGPTTSTPGSSTVTSAPSEAVDACSVDRGGCDQYCVSSGPNVICVCSDSFVLSPLDNKICDDPCEKDNGGCHQLCSVSNHQVVCACYDGYTINPDDGTLCIEKDECLAVNCTNGGTCVDLMNRFFCNCVDGWIGETCHQKAKADPVLISMHQDKGPVAGGTRITLRGRDFIKGALLTLGEGIQCSFNIQESNSTVAILTTPVVRTEDSNKALSVTVRFPGYEALNTDFTFTYKANPTLQSVYPLKANIIGGTSFTVNGEALDIVSDSRIEITMVHKYTEIGITKTNSTLYNSTCEVKVSTSMNCLAPKVDIPPSFRTVEEETDQTIVTERETLDFFLGFRLDGVPTYTNLSDTIELIDYRKVSYLTEEPEVLQSSFSPFVLNSGATISIKGSGFLQGFEPSDYRVAIGSGWCRDVDVTDNEIICAPPDILSGINSKRKKRGTDTDSDYIYREGERPKRAAREVVVDVFIHAGANLQINAGTIRYLINDKTAKKPNGASISAGVTMTTVLGVLAGWMLA